MRVKAVFIQEYYKAIGKFNIELEVEEGSTVMDLILYIDSKIYPGFKDLVLEGDKLRYPVEIAVNGRRVDFLDDLDTRLSDGDKVLFSPRALFIV